MTAPRVLLAVILAAGAAVAADSGVAQSAAGFEAQAAKAPKALAIEFRLRAAQALQDRYPELSRKFVNEALDDLRSGEGWVVGSGVMQALAELSPDDAIAILPRMAPAFTTTLIGSLAQTHRLDRAVAVFNDARARGQVRPTAISAVLPQLARENPKLAAKLFEEAIAALRDPLEPADAWWLISASAPLAGAAPAVVVHACERVLEAAKAPDYGRDANSSIAGSFQIGQGSSIYQTANSRDTLLLAAGGRLWSVSPERLAEYKELLAKWKIDGPATAKSLNFKNSTASAAANPPDQAISKRIGTMRSLATDADRARLVLDVVPQIRALPAGSARLSLIQGLAGVSTEGDLGKPALTAVATTLSETIRASYPKMMAAGELWAYGDGYVELAKLVRYERVTVPGSDSALDAAGALLDLRERVQSEIGFTLTALDGKTYTLAALKGHIVLLNFWATWCPPCRKEMPDMEKLFRSYESQGLLVLAVSDEARATVESFLAKNPYTFPVLLDPDRKVNEAFSVEGIPKSFIFDREGRLAAMAIDMRTESQFMELLRKAGL